MPSCRPFEVPLNIRVSSFDSFRWPHNQLRDTVVIWESGQKCSALSRLYVSSSLWKNGFKDKLLEEVAKIKVGSPLEFGNFMGPVM